MLALRAGRPQMTQIYADGYATGCCLWDSAESVGGVFCSRCELDARRLCRFAQMATLLDVICGILWDLWETNIFASLMGLIPQMTQICTDGYAAGCYLWDSVGSVGGIYLLALRAEDQICLWEPYSRTSSKSSLWMPRRATAWPPKSKTSWRSRSMRTM